MRCQQEADLKPNPVSERSRWPQANQGVTGSGIGVSSSSRERTHAREPSRRHRATSSPLMPRKVQPTSYNFLIRVTKMLRLSHRSSRTVLKQLARSASCRGSETLRLFSAAASAVPEDVDTSSEKAFRRDIPFDENGFIEFNNLHDLQVFASQEFAERDLFGTFSPESKSFEWISFADYGNRVDQCRALLKDLGVTEYGKIGIISNNRWEWAVIASAAYSLNANLVPMYEAQLPSDWSYIVNDSEATVLFCATQEIYDQVQSQVKPNCLKLQTSLCFDTRERDAPYSFQNLMSKYEPDQAHSLVIAPTQDDLANLIYTSGTTGKPKGVELSHNNISSNVKSAARTTTENPTQFITRDDRTLAFLPWAHVYGQTCELWNGVAHGFSMGICRGIPNIVEDLSLVRPTALYAVPTLYKRIFDGVNNMIETASPIRKRLMKSALAIGHERAQAANGNRGPLSFFERTQFNLLDKVVLSKVRARFGGNLRFGFVGGAACPSEVTAFMDSIGISVYEGYGLTETSPIIACNSPDYRKIGSVGRPLGGVHVYIVDEEGNEVPTGEEGEICCSGPNVMRGYYNNKEATDEVITTAPDGVSRMFHTGDLGRLDADGYLRVTGRLKEQYKLENGKYVVPTPIEDAIGLSRFISQVVVCGANRPHNVALLVPDIPLIRQECEVAEDVPDSELANQEFVRALIDQEIEQMCGKIKKFERPKAWAFVEPFTAAEGLLTPKMSIRRHKVIHKYGDVIYHLYGDENVVAEAADSQGAKEHPGE